MWTTFRGIKGEAEKEGAEEVGTLEQVSELCYNNISTTPRRGVVETRATGA